MFENAKIDQLFPFMIDQAKLETLNFYQWGINKEPCLL